jgi:hypothetical protein
MICAVAKKYRGEKEKSLLENLRRECDNATKTEEYVIAQRNLHSQVD